MQIIRNKQPSHKKPVLIIIFVIILLLLTISVVYYIYNRPSNNNSSTNETKTDETTTTLPASSDPSTTTSKTPVNNQPVDEQTPAGTVNANITYTTQTSSSLRIGTLIETVTSTGSCTLTMTKGDKTFTQTVDIQALASSSTCKGFDVPLASLSSGLWDIKIDIILADKEAHLSNSITIQ